MSELSDVISIGVEEIFNRYRLNPEMYTEEERLIKYKNLKKILEIYGDKDDPRIQNLLNVIENLIQ